MCYEERVLYRLLSGMHTAVNVHVALKAKMPKKNVPGREDWSADPARFVRQYGAHPERLRNLHFSFVVLLRALRKAAPALQAMDLTLGQDPEEDRRVRLLMRRLLDTHILSSCSNVFGAFDESALFKAAETAAKEAKGPGGAEEEAGDRGGGRLGGGARGHVAEEPVQGRVPQHQRGDGLHRVRSASCTASCSSSASAPRSRCCSWSTSTARR